MNNCNKNGDCWCGYEFFPKEIFDLIQEYQLGKSCICKDCLDQFKSDNNFKIRVNTRE
ncbi:hypothetical protein BC6307_06495 [Sutcliffiella cohnii]|uniref:Cysteine-rich CWC n=2 Tax=Sutcliffiella cohnii TaxID=33932 RepID=A0A223KXU4_9BACI|nr:hypothetical protein BC6307_06495 [Sutcliffiella cohnii]